jgi:hypothetical protein
MFDDLLFGILMKKNFTLGTRIVVAIVKVIGIIS